MQNCEISFCMQIDFMKVKMPSKGMDSNSSSGHTYPTRRCGRGCCHSGVHPDLHPG